MTNRVCVSCLHPSDSHRGYNHCAEIGCECPAYIPATSNREKVKEQIAHIVATMRRTDEPADVASSILALPDIEVRAENQGLPPFARVDIVGKPEVGRWYDGVLAGQQDMLVDGWVKCERQERSESSQQ